MVPATATTEYLTEALQRSGALGNGRVREATPESSRTTLLSSIVRLRLDYEGAAGPATIILKTGQPDSGGGLWNAGRQEVAFYSKVAAAMPPGRVPGCFDAHWDAETRAWHLMLEDLSETHFIATAWPLPPAREQCERIVDAWAGFHVAWWDDPRLGVSVGAWRDEAATGAYVRNLAAQFPSFADRLGDALPLERRRLYESVLDAAPRLLERLQSRRNVTIIHGDAHVWNAFIPREEAGTLRLFDWDAWTLNIATNDLAYMMAVHWYPDRRQRHERALLDRYHAGLVAGGVGGYDRRALDDDYRLSTLFQIMRPLFQAAHGIPPVIWWGNLERVMLAVDDLGCRDLLG